jgi:glucan phosphoethanolaminetransferase (alkaline phosphatase superfamily)
VKKISIARVALAGLIASLAFLFVEIVVEGAFQLIFGINEAEIAREIGMKIPTGTLHYVLTIVYLYLVCSLIMWVYAAIRPRFKSQFRAALATSFLFWLFAFLFVTNYSNVGFFPLKFALLGMGFNLVEIPAATIAGALVYRD